MKKNKIKPAIYDIIRDDYKKNNISNLFDKTIIILIILNVLLVILDTFKLPEAVKSIFSTIEIISIIIFSIEYILRIWTSNYIYPNLKGFKARIKYFFTIMALIDLLSILPFFIPFIIPIDLRVLRIFRLFRLFRLLKFNRYTQAFSNIQSVIVNKSSQLLSSMFVLSLLMIISSIIMYNLESQVQPEVFKNAFSGFWWTLNTITTVGYGDIYPITIAGKILSGVISLLGIALVAVPTGIISAGFIESSDENRGYTKMENIKNELLILKELLDKEIITEIDYEQKKTQILNN
jgi:voltage-gated potassium channel